MWATYNIILQFTLTIRLILNLEVLRDAPFDIGGGGGEILKKRLKKKFVKNVGTKKSLLSKFMKKILFSLQGKKKVCKQQ